MPLTLAQRSNLLSITPRGYAFWRARSLSRLADQPFLLAREAALFRILCRPQAGQLWLDVGTSTGFYAGVLARCGCQVLGVDLSAGMLREARKRETSQQITWALLNMESSELADETFDGVTIGATLNETHDPARLLREVARVTRPGGQLWLMYVPRMGGLGQQLLSRLGGLTFPDPAWVEQQLPDFRRVNGLRVGAVQFEHFLKASGAKAAGDRASSDAPTL